jgi:hypothetical protein
VLKRFKSDILFGGKKLEPMREEETSNEVTEVDEVTEITEAVVDNEPVVIVEEKIDIIQNIVDAPVMDSPVPEQEDIIIDKESFLKNKKLLEKIVYEALVLRKEGKLDEYEKKLIE